MLLFIKGQGHLLTAVHVRPHEQLRQSCLSRPIVEGVHVIRCYAPAVGHEIVHQPAVVLDPAGHPVYGHGTAAGLVPASSQVEVGTHSALCVLFLCLCHHK